MDLVQMLHRTQTNVLLQITYREIETDGSRCKSKPKEKYSKLQTVQISKKQMDQVFAAEIIKLILVFYLVWSNNQVWSSLDF